MRSRKVAVVDLETAALKDPITNTTECRALVYTIGAVKFDLYDPKPLFSPDGIMALDRVGIYYSAPFVEEQRLSGRIEAEDTADWWAKQSKRAIAARDGEHVGTLVPRALTGSMLQCISQLSDFLSDCDQVFCRGKEFDGDIILHMAHHVNQPAPWKFTNLHDVRTYISAKTGSTKGYIDDYRPFGGIRWNTDPGKTKPNWLVSHCSLHDALFDAEQLRIVTTQHKRWWEFWK